MQVGGGLLQAGHGLLRAGGGLLLAGGGLLRVGGAHFRRSFLLELDSPGSRCAMRGTSNLRSTCRDVRGGTASLAMVALTTRPLSSLRSRSLHALPGGSVASTRSLGEQGLIPWGRLCASSAPTAPHTEAPTVTNAASVDAATTEAHASASIGGLLSGPPCVLLLLPHPQSSSWQYRGDGICGRSRSTVCFSRPTSSAA